MVEALLAEVSIMKDGYYDVTLCMSYEGWVRFISSNSNLLCIFELTNFCLNLSVII